MEDQELLGLAAAAYFGADGFEWNACSGCIEYIPSGCRSYAKWKPLTDDGDALRLAVKLRMNVDIADGESIARIFQRASIFEPQDGDPFAATRRAIVRAAARLAQ